MFKKILLALILVATTTFAHAENDLKTAVSKAYVDTSVETLQDKIPAANTPGVGAGETVMTYTATGNGQIGERGIYTGANGYEASTDADKLITASALNATFTNLPTTDTTKLECANLNDGCTLWTIVDQTAYGRHSKNLFNKATATTGAILASTGAQGTNLNYKGSDFISVIAGENYYLSGNDFAIGNVGAYYKADKTYLSGINANGLLTVPNGAYYIRFSMDANSIDTTQFEQGTTATPYEPYY